jgi:hypothetical protein
MPQQSATQRVAIAGALDALDNSALPCLIKLASPGLLCAESMQARPLQVLCTQGISARRRSDHYNLKASVALMPARMRTGSPSQPSLRHVT